MSSCSQMRLQLFHFYTVFKTPTFQELTSIFSFRKKAIEVQRKQKQSNKIYMICFIVTQNTSLCYIPSFGYLSLLSVQYLFSCSPHFCHNLCLQYSADWSVEFDPQMNTVHCQHRSHTTQFSYKANFPKPRGKPGHLEPVPQTLACSL